MSKKLALTLACLLSLPAAADVASDLSAVEGYVLVAVATVDGYKDAQKSGDDFEGCEYDRVIHFRNGMSFRCMTYNYSYSYAPSAAIFAKEIGSAGKQTLYSVKVLIQDHLYDMSR